MVTLSRGIGPENARQRPSVLDAAVSSQDTPVEYDMEFTVRRVRQNGEIKWRGRLLYISEVLAKKPIGLKPINDDQWELRYSFHRLGILDMRTQKILPAKHWHSDK